MDAIPRNSCGNLRWPPEDNIKEGTVCIGFSVFWITCWTEVKFRVKNVDIRVLAFSWLSKDFAYGSLGHIVLSLLKHMTAGVLCTQTAQLFKPEFRPTRTLLVANWETQEAHPPAAHRCYPHTPCAGPDHHVQFSKSTPYTNQYSLINWYSVIP